jgi:SAM-dependent methyltransferase
MDKIAANSDRQYEAFPCPDPLIDIADRRLLEGDLKNYCAFYWPDGRPRQNLRILIAGCGTNQATIWAQANPDCDVVGIDVSSASIAHEVTLRKSIHLRIWCFTVATFAPIM